jgi:hypothetical protein
MSVITREILLLDFIVGLLPLVCEFHRSLGSATKRGKWGHGMNLPRGHYYDDGLDWLLSD